jgi:hypothetical protein
MRSLVQLVAQARPKAARHPHAADEARSFRLSRFAAEAGVGPTEEAPVRIDEYTPDAICQAMGLPSFTEDTSHTPERVWLRLVFMPSFHPEVCLTLTGSPQEPRVSVVALPSMLWKNASVAVPPGYREATAITLAFLTEARAQVHSLLTAAEADVPGIALDGMSVAVAAIAAGQSRRLQIHSSSPTACRIIGPLVQSAWQLLSTPLVRNALSRCAWYLGVILPEDPEPHPAQARQILVLGVEDDRRDLLRALSRKSEDG